MRRWSDLPLRLATGCCATPPLGYGMLRDPSAWLRDAARPLRLAAGCCATPPLRLGTLCGTDECGSCRTRPRATLRTLVRRWPDSAQGSADSWLPGGPKSLTVF